MRYHFVEIGTCDYDTLLERCAEDERGIAVEPIKQYLDRLPDRPNVTKIHAAISAQDGLVDLYWVRPEQQERPGFSCTKGWGSVVEPHPAHRAQADVLIREGILTREPVQAITWLTLVELCGITAVDFVKVDAEGHDAVIINSILDAPLPWVPRRIQFETTHVDADALQRAFDRLHARGYRVVSLGEDAVFEQPSAARPAPAVPASTRLPVEVVHQRRTYVLFKNDCGISDAIRSGGVYESYLFDYIRDRVRVEGTTIVDVGANLGQHALEFAELTGPTGTVHAFEAQRLVYYQLCANIVLNGVGHVVAHQVALGAERGKVTMVAPDLRSSERINVGSAYVGSSGSPQEVVDLRPLDAYGLTNVSVLKIDVEGYEPYVLDGARATIAANRPVICVEIWDANLALHGFTAQDVFTRLDALGYRWSKLIDADHIIDYVAVPR